MTGNDTNGFSPLDDGLLSVQSLPDETGRKRKDDRLVITGSPLGPQLLMFHSLDEYEEVDPNP